MPHHALRFHQQLGPERLRRLCSLPVLWAIRNRSASAARPDRLACSPLLVLTLSMNNLSPPPSPTRQGREWLSTNPSHTTILGNLARFF